MRLIINLMHTDANSNIESCNVFDGVKIKNKCTSVVQQITVVAERT